MTYPAEKIAEALNDLLFNCGYNDNWKLRQSADKAHEALAEWRESQQATPSIDPKIMILAQLMQNKLDKNKHKEEGWDGNFVNGERSWQECSIFFLADKLHEEANEATDLIDQYEYNGDNSEKIRELIKYECADVANIAMMIADNLGALQPPKVDDD